MDVHMNELLQATIDEGGSDLHIRARMPPELRVHGELCPLSDEALTEALNAGNIAIARRTVAKYREAAGIPKRSLRRKYS